MDGLFKDNKDLIKVNLTDLNMKDVVSMKSTFSGCSNLNEITFGGINTTKLTEMENTFENCSKLKNLDLSPLDTTNLIEINNIFAGCSSLETLNLSSFQKINNNTFNKISSKPNIISNDLISNDISNIFYNLYSMDINIINYIYDTKSCKIGEKEKCKTCSKKIKSNCLTCNEGYYLPYHELDNKVCLPCNKIEHCISCFGEKNYLLCSSCELGYDLSDNKCKLQKTEIPNCTIGEKEKCKECNSNPKLRNQCKTCNEGYYLSENDNESKNRTICQKCDIEGCLECFGTEKNKLCSKCDNGFEFLNNKCIKEKCVIGANEKCASCRTENGREKVCATCNEGYFIRENSNSSICSKCTLNNCKKCAMQSGEEICLECKNNFKETKNINNIIEKCTCPSDYKLENDLCLEYENWIEMEYNVTDPSTKNKIMNTRYTKIQLNELDLYVNNSLVSLLEIESSNSDKPLTYKFDKKGIYKIKMNIKKTLKTMQGMFVNLKNIKSIKFLPGFDSSQVTNMNLMYAVTLFDSIDMKYLNTSNLLSLKDFLEASYSLSSLDISNFNTSKTYNMRGMFYGKNKLKEIDLSSFDTSKVSDCLIMFHDLQTNCTIKISNKFTKCREQISFDNKIINVDDLNCNKFENCEKCGGSKETLICIKCKTNYELINNQCIKSKCNLGENEKCLSCQNIKGKENECQKCNEGYYLPTNGKNTNQCLKCKIEGCKTCDNNGNCLECKLYYEPIFDKNNKTIVNCNLLCDLGKEEKCSTCETEKAKKSQCGSCNLGYKLINGKCKKIENSFIGIYNAISITQFTRIMCVSYNNIKLSDFDMYANGKKVIPYIGKGKIGYSDYNFIAYVFNSLGKQEVKIIFNKTLVNMKNLFYGCYDLISIEFNEAFDTSHVLCMYYMFGRCESLQHINISSFNTSLVGDMEGMFDQCNSLTSLDLSNFDTKNVDYMQCIFANSKKLSYLDISSFDLTYLAGAACMFDGLAENGTVIINNKFNRQSSLPKGWKIIKKN